MCFHFHFAEFVFLNQMLQSLRKMSHPNIVKLKEVIREHDILHFVFEYMECNLYQLMKDRGRPFSENEIRNWFFQVFQALAYMHQRGYFHRDLKPENLLVSKNVIKIADFGLAREISSGPPYTEYVSTRWYRAPEVLLQSPTYTSAVDMWAMGAIMAELFTLRPLFPGLSEADEIYKICNVIGSPTENSWAHGLLLARAMNYQFPQLTGVHLSTFIPSASDDAISLIKSLCSWDPFKRPTAAEVLRHPFFQNCFCVPPSLRAKTTVHRTPPSLGTRGYSEQKSARKSSGSGSLPVSKTTNLKPHVAFGAGVQRKLDMDGKDLNKNDKSVKSSVKQPKYRPPIKNSSSSIYSGRTTRGISEAAEKLANMSLSSGRQAMRQSIPPPMKAGGWHGQSNMFMGRSQEIQPSRAFTRRVAG
ncbi:cyclin-dependent kinase F-4-like isoform X1 [Amaranthus tricolor]|uniref:cyclin-dependent kinase F-4-like isoform X1 n=1 Tax=Amaranthus tricolor TaxID=29722 RepID=UPI00258D4D4A|nr:cyclin-dependent kinase F-4-like isoform X1 [Amaranthus tricolor]